MCEINDANLWLADSGVITDRELLPIQALSFGDTGAETEWAYLTVEPLNCHHGKYQIMFYVY